MSVKNTKAKGRRREWQSMRILEACGYNCTRAAASLGAWDIIAIASTDIVLVQCKSRDWPSEEEMKRLRNFPVPPNARKIIHRYVDGRRAPDVRDVE